MTLSILIVSWNTRDLLAACLESIFTHPPQCEFDVWVVDNASTDGSVAMVREQFPETHLIANRENVGFARANNQGIRASRGRHVLLLNPDTEVGPDALERLVRFLDERPEAGAVGARLLNPDGSLQTSCYPAPTLLRELWRLFHLDVLKPYGTYRMDAWDTTAPREVEVLQGACLLIRREVLDRIGLLDADYFMYSEEVDLCHRIRTHGWSLYWVPHATVVHYGGQSTQQVAADMFLHLYQSKIMYFRTHHGEVAARAYKLILLAAALVRLSVSPVSLLESPSTRKRHLELADNYRRLVASLPAM